MFKRQRQGADTTTLANSLALSISAHLLAIATITVAFLILSSSLHDRLSALSRLASVDSLLAIRDLASQPVVNGTPLLRRDLPDFFSKAQDEASAPTKDGTDPNYIETQEQRGFTSEKIEGAYIVQVASRVLHMRCHAAIIPIKEGTPLTFVTNRVVGKVYKIDSGQAKMIVLDRCFSDEGHEGFFVLTSGHDTVVAYSASFENQFPPIAPPRPFESFPFYDTAKVIDLLPEPIRQVYRPGGKMITNHVAAFDQAILDYASMRHDRFYSPDDFAVAASRLFDEQEKPGSLFGLNAQPHILLDLGPIAFFMVTFELWRRTRKLVPGQHVTVFWFASDTDDVLGRLAARLYALLPIICCIAVYVSYGLATGASFVSRADMERFVALLRLGSSPLEAMSWISLSLVATAVFILAIVQTIVVIEIARNLLRIIGAPPAKLKRQRLSTFDLRRRRRK
jgi:hypothetical protein